MEKHAWRCNYAPLRHVSVKKKHVILITGGEKGMPTFNQLVRKGRKSAVKKSTAPALLKTYIGEKSLNLRNPKSIEL